MPTNGNGSREDGFLRRLAMLKAASSRARSNACCELSLFFFSSFDAIFLDEEALVVGFAWNNSRHKLRLEDYTFYMLCDLDAR